MPEPFCVSHLFGKVDSMLQSTVEGLVCCRTKFSQTARILWRHRPAGGSGHLKTHKLSPTRLHSDRGYGRMETLPNIPPILNASRSKLDARLHYGQITGVH
ncbi:hypothetical protein K0M31_006891 [Melipona bicolor]|uniref:Uncharacterized protein n=1 Tax=Melipona bicolor TaxID=60889 RepID=A0AA40FSI9_9HYME|nr:hypothetical protein K0M31_006891 [Melipona bicolor]